MKVSIIIPVYNSEKNLKYCLESILKQTYQDFEILLINDGSTDNSQEVIDRYKKNFSNKIRAYIQKNSGVAKTRNRGIELSKGEYLFFIDNDDRIDTDYVKTFVDAIEESNYDIIIGGYRRVDEDGKILFSREPINSPWVKYMFITPWAKIYRKESLISNNLSFLDINIGEDVWLNIMANLKLKIGTVQYTGYNWIYNNHSISNALHKGLKKDVDFIPLLQRIKEDSISIKISQEEKNLLEYFMIKTSVYYILHSGRKTKYSLLKSQKEDIFNWLKESYPSYKNNPLISPFSPKGEAFSTCTIVWTYILLQKLHLENAFLWLYSKL